MKQELSLSELNVNRWSIISEGDVSIDLDSPTIEELNEKCLKYLMILRYNLLINRLLIVVLLVLLLSHRPKHYRYFPRI
jgi:hypothetical protein